MNVAYVDRYGVSTPIPSPPAGGGVLLDGPGPAGGGGWGRPSSRSPSSSIRISLISRSVHARTVCRYKCFATAELRNCNTCYFLIQMISIAMMSYSFCIMLLGIQLQFSSTNQNCNNYKMLRFILIYAKFTCRTLHVYCMHCVVFLIGLFPMMCTRLSVLVMKM